ncbi:hypothetical protein ACC759_38890, partial [Rhizobium ruizarguesonis]
LVRLTDSSEAKKLLKGMSYYLAAQKTISFAYDANLQVVTNSASVSTKPPERVACTLSGRLRITVTEIASPSFCSLLV